MLRLSEACMGFCVNVSPRDTFAEKCLFVSVYLTTFFDSFVPSLNVVTFT